MDTLLSAIKSSATLMREGAITEYLPQYAELTYRFNAGLTVRVAHHVGDKFQATLDGFYNLDPCTASELIDYLESLD